MTQGSAEAGRSSCESLQLSRSHSAPLPLPFPNGAVAAAAQQPPPATAAALVREGSEAVAAAIAFSGPATKKTKVRKFGGCQVYGYDYPSNFQLGCSLAGPQLDWWLAGSRSEVPRGIRTIVAEV